MPHPKGHTWRKGRPAFWEQLRAILQLAMQQPTTSQAGPVQGFMSRIRHAHRHWVGAPTWAQFLDTCHHWHRFRDPHAADLMLQTIGHQLQETQQAATDEVTLQYRQWLQEGYQKGLKGLFRSLKSSELAWERPYRMTPMPQRMDQRLADWGGLWRIRQDNAPSPRPSLQSQAKQQAQSMPTLTQGMLQKVFL